MAETLAYLTAGAIPLTWFVAYLLWRNAKESPDLAVLRERAVVQTAVAALVTVFGLIFLNNDSAIPPLSTDITKIVTRGTVFVVALVTSLGFLMLYRGRTP